MSRTVTADEIRQMREWITDCVWADLDEDSAAELSDSEVIAGIQRHYCGGLNQFLTDCAPL